MKNVKYVLLVIIFLLSGIYTRSHAIIKTDTIKVWGNCGMCEQRIEKAAKKAGAIKARWNMNTKCLIVTYDDAKISNNEIQQKIAAVGHDTELYSADAKTYQKLDACCHYDRKKQ